MGHNKRNRFQEAFERGQKGEISSYSAWLQDEGFNPDRINHEYITEYFRENPEQAPNHEDQLDAIAEFLGFFTRRPGTYHVPVIGPGGIGKTQLLHTIHHMTRQLNQDIEQRHYSAAEFIEEGKEESRWYEITDELEQIETAVILLDDCEQDKRIDHSLDKISSKLENSYIITSWTPEHWRIERERVNDVLPVSREVELANLSETNTVAALEATVETYSNGRSKLPQEIYKRLFEASLGIPLLFHELLRKSLNRAYLMELDQVTVEAVNEAVVELNLDNIKERVYDIPEKKLLILKHILLSRHPQGRRPSELVDRLDRDKSTISYHLQNLIENRILEKQKQGRSVFYQVRDPVKPVLQQRLAKEGEFYA